MTLSLPNTAGELAVHVLRQQSAAFAEHAPQVRDDSDPEHVHQARVATRRMRAALRVFKDALPVEISALNDELAWVAAQLGPVRDMDVQLQQLRELASSLGLLHDLAPYVAWLDAQRQRSLVALEDAFQSQRFAIVTERLHDLDHVEIDAETAIPLRQDAAQRLRSAHQALRKRADGLREDSPPALFHRARIAAKRLRYTAEFLEPLYGKPAQRLIARTTDLQDLLGSHQDSFVSSQHVEEAIQTAAVGWPIETAVALGRLVQWELQRGGELRQQFRSQYRAVEDEWARLRRAL
jgi:CHAD domain-containing protein